MNIDPTLQAFIPPLSADERAKLEAAIVETGGATDPIIVWGNAPAGPTVVDGHNRFEICSRLGLPYRTDVRSFQDISAVKSWMFTHQISRRNLSPDQLTMLGALRGLPVPVATATARMREMAAELVEHAPEIAAQVLSGRPLAITYGAWARKTGRVAPRPVRAPSAKATAPEGPTPREAATIAADRREEERRRAERAEAKAMSARLVELEDALHFMHRAPAQAPVVETPGSRPKSGKRVATPVFLISDTHFGETVTLEESLGQNEYNLRVAAARMRKCWDNMLWLRADMARTQTCDDTILCLNGDIVSGDIHDELRETNDGGMVSQCNAAFAALAPGIRAMAEVTPGVLHVVCIGGNHGRLTHKQHIKNGTEHSAEHLGVYGPLRSVIGDQGGKIAWHIPRAERYVMTVHGKRVSQQHGTMIRSMGGIGGTLVPMNRWATRTNDADLYLFGHFHEADAFGRIIKNGALIGESGYTKWLGVESRPPEQVAFVLDADAGVRRFERVSVLAGKVGQEG